MEDKNYLSKKIKRKNDKNMPHYNKEDELKYDIKNKLFEKNKKLRNQEKETNKDIIKSKKNIKNSKKDMDEEMELNEENEYNDIEEENGEINTEDNNIINEESLEEDNKITNENDKYNLFSKNKKLIIILEGATLELGSLKKNPQIINCDDHYKIIKSMKKKLDEYRPDIVHQCLLNLLDSPLNKIGVLQVYIHTNKNILIEINPKMRMPRTFKRFSGLFTQLLLKNEIKASDTDDILMKIRTSNIENIIDKNVPKILLSGKGRLIDIDTYCKNLSKVGEENKNSICFIIGTNPKGDIDPLIKYNDDCISISSFELNSNIVCAKICSSLEKVWDIL